MATTRNSRRDFIKTSVAGAAGIAISSRASSYARIIGANDRVRVAFVGPGDRARDALIPSFLRLAGELNFEPVAVCDIWNKRRDEGADFVAQQDQVSRLGRRRVGQRTRQDEDSEGVGHRQQEVP